jgi:hypothetical protein
MVMVRLGRDPAGHVTLIEILSPVLSPEEQRALIRAFEAGEWKRAAPTSPAADTWIETIVRTRH